MLRYKQTNTRQSIPLKSENAQRRASLSKTSTRMLLNKVGGVGGRANTTLFTGSLTSLNRGEFDHYTQRHVHTPWLPQQPPTCDRAHGVESGKGWIDVLLLAPLHHALEHAHQTFQSLVIMTTTTERK